MIPTSPLASWKLCENSARLSRPWPSIHSRSVRMESQTVTVYGNHGSTSLASCTAASHSMTYDSWFNASCRWTVPEPLVIRLGQICMLGGVYQAVHVFLTPCGCM